MNIQYPRVEVPNDHTILYVKYLALQILDHHPMLHIGCPRVKTFNLHSVLHIEAPGLHFLNTMATQWRTAWGWTITPLYGLKFQGWFQRVTTIQFHILNTKSVASETSPSFTYVIPGWKSIFNCYIYKVPNYEKNYHQQSPFPLYRKKVKNFLIRLVWDILDFLLCNHLQLLLNLFQISPKF